MNDHLRWTSRDLLFLLLLLSALFVGATDVTLAEPKSGNTTESVKTRVANDKRICGVLEGTFTSEFKEGQGMSRDRTETRCEERSGTTHVCLHFESSWQCWDEISVPDEDDNRVPLPDEAFGDTPDGSDPVVTPERSIGKDDVQLKPADLTPAPVTPEPTVLPDLTFQG